MALWSTGMNSHNKELEVLAAAVHGGIMGGNLLGILWNLRRGNWTWVGIHTAGVIAHAVAVRQHAKNVASADGPPLPDHTD
jgi:hypothetical protein